MMTVRFFSGFSVQYNTANHVTYGEHHNVLRTAKDGDFIAVVPTDAIVEAVYPCRMYNASADHTIIAVQQNIELLRKEIRSFKRKLVKS